MGIRGPGYKLGQTEECFRYPVCCTESYCPVVNATREWLVMGGVRLDTGYPFGDSQHRTTCGGIAPAPGLLQVGVMSSSAATPPAEA